MEPFIYVEGALRKGYNDIDIGNAEEYCDYRIEVPRDYPLNRSLKELAICKICATGENISVLAG